MGPGSPFAQVMQRWNELPRARQLLLAGIAGGTLLVLYFVFLSSSKPAMVVAYSGLEPEETAAIVDQLEQEGVPYEISAGGTAVAIPANQVSEVSIKLAAAGLGKGSTLGFEIFDKTNFGATDKVQDINFVRALQGELARSINTLEGVKASRVHIVIPKEALFKEDQQETTAAVVLDLKPGAQLSQDQVRGITNLVTNAVPGLQLGGVSITDTQARVLFDGKAFANPFAAGASASQLEIQRQYEAALTRDVQATLERVVGAGRSAVTIRAQLNFDQVQESEETFAGDQAVPRSQVTTTETFSGSNLNVGNVPGTGTNGGTNAGAQAGANGSSTYQRTETTTNNEIPKTVTTTVKAPGSLQRLSVSVVLDESVPAAQAASIESAVAAAVGLDQTRGDTMSVIRFPFDTSIKEEFAVAGGDGLAQYLQYLKLLLPLLAVVLGFVLVMLLLRTLNKRQLALPSPYMAAAVSGPGMSFELPRMGDGDRPAIQAPVDPGEERLVKLAESNPKAVADVVQTWMREEAE